MERILLVLNAHKPDTASIQFACRIANLARTQLTGLFVENLYFGYIPDADMDSPGYFRTMETKTVQAVNADTDQAIRIFRDECQRQGVRSEYRVDKGEPVREVSFESRFADLLIIDPALGFYEREEQVPTPFVKEILAKAECPVLLTSGEFTEPQEIVFCYDGSNSAVFAIKQFTYLLPEFSDRKVVLLEVNRTGDEEFNDGHVRIMEWLRAHYHSVYYHTLSGDAKDELFHYFFKKENRFIVMGAYGRSLLSRLVSKSNADLLLKMVDLPIFITHH